MIIEYKKVRDGAQVPVRSNPSDAGLDVFACLDEAVSLAPMQSLIIPTGLKFGIPHGYMLQVMNRSSVAAKRGLVVGAHVIDSGYDGEVFINIHNISNQHQVLRDGMKIAQLVMIPVVSFRPYEIGEDALYHKPITISDRGDGALGSTGG
jgi:dUTP pyrophosphatase